MRKCIKCGELKRLSEFLDHWYARTNICNDCRHEASSRRWAESRERKKQAALEAYRKRLAGMMGGDK